MLNLFDLEFYLDSHDAFRSTCDGCGRLLALNRYAVYTKTSRGSIDHGIVFVCGSPCIENLKVYFAIGFLLNRWVHK